MSKSLAAQSCADFTEALSSPAPTPGGGAAAALTGALAAALCEMAGNLSRGKKRAMGHEEELDRLCKQAQALRLRFLALMDEDAAAFEPLRRAYALPKGEPETARELTEASLGACRPPMAMLRCCGEAVELLEALQPLCSPLLLSDLGCAAATARAALEAASLNVLVNTRGLSGCADAKALEREADALLAAFVPRAQALVQSVNNALRR